MSVDENAQTIIIIQIHSSLSLSLYNSLFLSLLSLRLRGTMVFPAAISIVPIGILFIISGLVVNLIQAIFFILVRPLSKSMYRRINKVVAELLWLELIWLFDWWAGIKIDLYTDSETYQLMGKEHALLICNHRSDVDWLVGWVLAQRSGCLGCAKAVMKKSLQFLPIIGWSMWFSDYVFLERSWAKDKSTLKSGFERLEDFPQPFWLGLFVEGTRFTQAKLLAAQEYAASAGLPVPLNVMIPRTKGFVSAVSHMRSFVPAIYDITVAIPKKQPSPTMLRIFRGQSSVVSVHIKRHLMQELPETDIGISQWCKDIFVDKDAFLDKYFATDSFGHQEFQDIGRPKKVIFCCYHLVMSPCPRRYQIVSIVLTLFLMERHCICGSFLGPCYNCHANPHSSYTVRVFYSCEANPARPNKRAASSKMSQYTNH